MLFLLTSKDMEKYCRKPWVNGRRSSFKHVDNILALNKAEELLTSNVILNNIFYSSGNIPKHTSTSKDSKLLELLRISRLHSQHNRTFYNSKEKGKKLLKRCVSFLSTYIRMIISP